MEPINKYDWYFLEKPDPATFQQTRESIHLIIQCLASIGRTYAENTIEEEDGAARLFWVPGLWRMAGCWIPAAKEFRGSLSLRDGHLYLVDPKLNTLDHFTVKEHSYHEMMLWFEKQIIHLELSTAQLSTEMPYPLPGYAEDHKKSFTESDLVCMEELGGHFHDAFVLFQQFQDRFEHATEVCIYPHHFDLEVKIILKKTDELATDTYIRLGFSPGDTSISSPHLYINSWPHVTGEKLPKAPLDGYWTDEEWYGLILEFNHVYGRENQQDYLFQFIEEGFSVFKGLLLD